MKKGELIHLSFDDNNLARSLFGAHARNLKPLETQLGIDIDVRGADVHLRGDAQQVAIAQKILQDLYDLLKKGYPVLGSDLEKIVGLVSRDKAFDLKGFLSDAIFIPARGKVIAPRSLNQRAYLEAMRANDLVFGIGPAGTGKTYLAVAMAVTKLMKREVQRIILARPAVEAGEKLGYLPGDIAEKINPYLRPLYDALYDMMDSERVRRMTESGVIEIAPLAFMRGRTLNASFIILDEAQNCTSEQMKMFLTRLGFDSQAVVTGDITQIDLPEGRPSGLVEARRILDGVNGIHFQYFDERDVVRHRLVQEIVKAYDNGKSRGDKA